MRAIAVAPIASPPAVYLLHSLTIPKGKNFRRKDDSSEEDEDGGQAQAAVTTAIGNCRQEGEEEFFFFEKVVCFMKANKSHANSL